MSNLTDEESFNNLAFLREKYETTILQKHPTYKNDPYQLKKMTIDQLYREKLINNATYTNELDIYNYIYKENLCDKFLRYYVSCILLYFVYYFIVIYPSHSPEIEELDIHVEDWPLSPHEGLEL